MTGFDIAIVGAGIAGVSLAAELAPHASVLLLEAEDQPGYHATGRSAAFWSESYGGAGVQPLTRASFAFLDSPPADMADQGFLRPRGALYIAEAHDIARLDRLADSFAGLGVALDRLDPAAMAARVPGLATRWAQGLFEPACRDIDVGGLHSAWLGAAGRRGATLVTRAGLLAAERVGERWRLTTQAGDFAADLLVNAAGAWADDVAAAAGARPLDIRPYRRSVAQLRLTAPAPPTLPLLLGIDESFYCKPEADGRLWLSPHDETPVAAQDAAAEESDIARALGRLGEVADWQVAAVERRWAGLRSFAPDRLPVIGFDPRCPGFFWLAGQGGFGIQTSPAIAMLAGAALLGRDPPPPVAAIDPARYRPARFG